MEVNPLWLIGVSVLLAMIPLIIGAATSYLKISIVFGLMRNALGTQQIPGPMIVSALSLALTVFIMGPTLHQIQDRVGQLPQDITKKGFNKETMIVVTEAFLPLKDFLDKHSGKREIAMLQNLREESKTKKMDTAGETNEPGTEWSIVVPAFMLSELKDAFSMGFVVLLPFLVIDLVVANVLTGMGMHMMSPMTISLPLKLILFVSSDAWLLLVKGLIHSYQ